MKIQIIGSKDREIDIEGYEIELTNFEDPKTLDSFDINIIDLQEGSDWYCSYKLNDIKITKALDNIRKLISSIKKTKVIIAHPQNYFVHKQQESSNNKDLFKLKNYLTDLYVYFGRHILPNQYWSDCPKWFDLDYEKSETKCNSKLFNSDFVFSKIINYNVKTRAKDSEKPTTINLSNLYITTLDLFSDNKGLHDFLLETGLDVAITATPDWINDLDYFDDKNQKSLIKENEEQITVLNQQIDTAKDKLAKNLYFKSVLYECGNNLVAVVFDMLQDIFNYNLSNFEDKKDEDFLIKLQDITFIGEIKGISTNVKLENITQADNHRSTRIDMLESKNATENIKTVLIINTFRNKPLSERETIHERQIYEAKKRNIIIVFTKDLLALYEKFVKKEISTDQVVKAFASQEGVFDIDNI